MRRTGCHRHAVKGNTQAALNQRTQSHWCSVPELARRGKLCNWRFWPVGLQEMQTCNQRPVAHASRWCSYGSPMFILSQVRNSRTTAPHNEALQKFQVPASQGGGRER